MAFPAGTVVQVNFLVYADAGGTHAKAVEMAVPVQPPATTAVSPSTVTLHYTTPATSVNASGTTVAWTVTSGQIVNSTTGTYHANLDSTALPGRWSYRWTGTGSNPVAIDGGFDITDDQL